jgi:hypothetical protein
MQFLCLKPHKNCCSSYKGTVFSKKSWQLLYHFLTLGNYTVKSHKHLFKFAFSM